MGEAGSSGGTYFYFKDIEDPHFSIFYWKYKCLYVYKMPKHSKRKPKPDFVNNIYSAWLYGKKLQQG